MIRKFLSQSRLKAINVYYGFHPRSIDCRVRSKMVKVYVSSWVEKFRADTYETKEPETLDWLDSELKDDDVLFDIGANIGVYSLYAAALNGKCKIFAFEPEATNFAHLCRNIYNNGFLNITPCNVAFWDHERFDYLHISDMTAGSAFHSLSKPTELKALKNSQVIKQGLLSSSLDRLVGHFGLPCPSLLKLDVDGGEGPILRGAAQTLRSGKVRSLLVEINGHTHAGPASEILGFFKSCGYRILRQGEIGNTANGEPSSNFILRL